MAPNQATEALKDIESLQRTVANAFASKDDFILLRTQWYYLIGLICTGFVAGLVMALLYVFLMSLAYLVAIAIAGWSDLLGPWMLTVATMLIVLFVLSSGYAGSCSCKRTRRFPSRS